jgi:regulator of sirC expression with transglutaminase-like and TPR domain
VNHLRQLLASDPTTGRLDRAALELATIQFPDLEAEPFLDHLNEMASRLGDRLRNFNDGRDFVETAQRYLFGELGFQGNKTDFFDPLNSCLNQVIERRTGIAITLSVMYMEIGRRLQMPIFGIGLPRHFVVEFNDGNYAAYIDPFNGGRVITPQECFALAGARVADPSLLRRVSKKYIVMRMLNNMQSAYLRRNDYQRAVAALDLLILGSPEASAYKRRGALLIDLKKYQAARRDLEQYLKLEPDAQDREEILERIAEIHRRLGAVN